jgi:hypothetical protein
MDRDARHRGRRLVLNDVRRTIERHARVAAAAVELADAADAVLAALDRGEPAETALERLRGAVATYRKASRDR